MRNSLKESATDRLGARNQAFLRFVGKDKIKNKIILDIGCGLAWFEYQNRKKAKKIWAIDKDGKHIEQNKKLLKDKNVVFTKGSALKIPLENESVEVIVASEVIEHLPKKTETIFFREARRVLKKKGDLFLSTPNNHLMAKLFDPAWYFGHRHYDYKKLRKIAETEGLQMKAYQINGAWWSLLGLINMYVAKWVFGRRKFWENFFEERELKESRSSGFMNLFIAFEKKEGDGEKKS